MSKSNRDIEKLEKKFIKSISFVPSEEEIEILLQQSIASNNAIKNKKPSNLLSKISALIPKSLNPNDTVLNTVVFEGAKKSGAIVTLKNRYLYVVNDRDVPFVSKSMGPNGILVECQKSYGKNRVNLFHKNMSSTYKLLDNYLTLRDGNINDIFKLFVNKLNTYKDGDEDMEAVVEMFNLVLKNIQENNNSLKKMGISVQSFCQTWMRKGNDYGALQLGPAQFSVMSPHFQTKFYISNSKLLKKVPGIRTSMIEKYYNILIKLYNNMQDDYGVKNNVGGGQAFVNLDLLYKMM